VKPRHQQNDTRGPQGKAAGKDLRPAVFIRDLKKRSIQLEEEKSQHREHLEQQAKLKQKERAVQSNRPSKDVKSEPKVPQASAPIQPRKSKVIELYRSKITRMQNAISKEDLNLLSDAIYDIKLHKVEEEAAAVRSLPLPESFKSSLQEKTDLTNSKNDLQRLINQAEELLIQISAKI